MRIFKKNNDIDLPVAYNRLSVFINPKNDFIDHLTVREHRKTLQLGSAVKTWSDLDLNDRINPSSFKAQK
jgi:ABC-type phosphate transport system substrate-binding protein